MKEEKPVPTDHPVTQSPPHPVMPSSLLWSALIFAMAFPTIMAWLYFVALAPDPASPAASGNLAVVVAYGAGKVIQFAFPLVFVLVYEPQLLRPTRPRWRGVLWGLGFGLAVCGAMFLLYDFHFRKELVKINAPAKIEAKLRHFGLNTPAGFLTMAVFLSLVHSLLEEYYWRWFVFGRLQRCLAVSAAIVVSGLAFMAHHVVVLAEFAPGSDQFFTKVVPFSIGIAAGGMVWAWLYYRTASIYAPWLSHLLIDAGLMVVGYDLVFGG
jgi:membrane protease YdiL (CAAX protease family)